MAATAPKVQNLSDIMAELNPSIQGQTDVINKQKAANAATFDAQRSALEGAKTKGFNQINEQATGRGMAFSGIPLNEQANYLADKYLPGIQAANAQQNADSLAYDKQIADLGANVFNKAFDTRNTQTMSLNDWNKMLSGQDFSRSERIAGQNFSSSQADKQRQFQAEQDALQRNFTASQNAAARAVSSDSLAREKFAYEKAQDKAANAPLTPDEAAQLILINASKSGKDITSNVFQSARDAYRAAGGDTHKFASDYWKYVPKDLTGNQWKNYYYG